jgi:hypothetical protein
MAAIAALIDALERAPAVVISLVRQAAPTILLRKDWPAPSAVRDA